MNIRETLFKPLSLNLDWHKHHTNPCLQISKVIDKYSMIADGLRSLHDAMINVREGYQATKRTMQQGVDDLRREIKSTGNNTYNIYIYIFIYSIPIQSKWML